MKKNQLLFILISTMILGVSCTKKPVRTSEWSKNAVIYEVNIRQFSKEGTFNQVTENLDRLKSLGVDILWLMPIHPIGELNKKGSLGSYYAVRDYKSVNPNYGTLDDFKNLVAQAHKKGMKVIIDWVANHSSPDNVWIKDHLDYYTKDSLGHAPIPTLGTDWMDVADLNYDNPKLRLAMQDAMSYWVTEADIDGFRCDVAEMVPLDFWIDTRKKLDKIKPIFMLAEGAKPDLYQAFDMIYGWPLKDLFLKIAKGEQQPAAVLSYRDSVYTNLPDSAIIMYFTTNHDENSWNYVEKDVFKENQFNFQTLTIVFNGLPLIYNGQESGLTRKIKFFDKDPIEWGLYANAAYFKTMMALYKENAALWNGKAKGNFKNFPQEDKHVIAFEINKDKRKVVVLQNYSNQQITIAVKQIFNAKTNFTDYLTKKIINIRKDSIDIPANGQYIYSE